MYYNQQKWELALTDYNKAVALLPHYNIAEKMRNVVYKKLESQGRFIGGEDEIPL